MLFKYWKSENKLAGSPSLGTRNLPFEPGSLVAIQGCVARTRMTTPVGWCAQELVLVSQNRLPEEWWWRRRGRQGTASPSPAGKAAAEARGRILGAGDWPGGGSYPEQVLSSSQWGVSECVLACPVEWNLLANYSLLSDQLSHYGLVDWFWLCWDRFWLAIPSWNSLCSPGYTQFCSVSFI